MFNLLNHLEDRKRELRIGFSSGLFNRKFTSLISCNKPLILTEWMNQKPTPQLAKNPEKNYLEYCRYPA
jgi:hypothetical protein